MDLKLIDEVARAVLYEGYLLYPYRPSAVKNRQRWNFGTLVPPAFAPLQGDSDSIRAEVLALGDRDARLEIRVRFLHLQGNNIEESPMNRVQAFLGPGHVCAVMGYREYEPISRRYKVPIVITGFEPLDLLDGILRTVRQLESGEAEVENQYSRVLSRDGNLAAQKLVNQVFEVCDRKWRGVGNIPKSGYKLKYEFRDHDAERIFEVEEVDTQESPLCISGLVLKGIKKPLDCPAFGKECTPEHPLGATMVSAEGACAAYHAYGRYSRKQEEVLQLEETGKWLRR